MTEGPKGAPTPGPPRSAPTKSAPWAVALLWTLVCLALLATGVAWGAIMRSHSQKRADAYHAATAYLATHTDTATPKSAAGTNAFDTFSRARVEHLIDLLAAESSDEGTKWLPALFAVSGAAGLISFWFFHFGMLQYHRYRSALESLITGRKEALDAASADAKDKANEKTRDVTIQRVTVAIRDIDKIIARKSMTNDVRKRLEEDAVTLRNLLLILEKTIEAATTKASKA